MLNAAAHDLLFFADEVVYDLVIAVSPAATLAENRAAVLCRPTRFPLHQRPGLVILIPRFTSPPRVSDLETRRRLRSSSTSTLVVLSHLACLSTIVIPVFIYFSVSSFYSIPVSTFLYSISIPVIFSILFPYQFCARKL